MNLQIIIIFIRKIIIELSPTTILFHSFSFKTKNIKKTKCNQIQNKMQEPIKN